jgi:two-component system phosphate regulon sensor histidine kinase PhoR
MESKTTDSTRCRVLLIEDDKLDQMAFARLVEKQKLPYDYSVADSLAQARSILKSDIFDIVIVDYFLGDGTAFDVLEMIEDTPVIFATGAGDEEIAVKAMKAGAYDYVIKDMDRNYLKVLPQVVKKAIVHKRTEDALKQYHNNLEALVRERTEQLAEEKELLAVTLASMSDGVIVVDSEKRIILFNKVAENLTKWKSQEVQQKPVDQILRVIDEKTQNPVESPIDKVLASGQIEGGTERDALVSRDASRCPISATAAPISKNDGTIIGVVMVLRDVSREREIDRMKRQFISSVSHELRTPITAIKAYAATILRDENMPEQTRREFLNVIDEESDLLKNLIEDLLEVSRIESGKVKFSREPVDITPVIDQVISAVQHLADKKNIRLRTNIGDALGQLQGDVGKIQSMVMNLVQNAIKFTPEKGRVSVSVQRHAQELVVRVSDTGMGIPKEALPKIFDRFYRVHRPDKPTKGTGLGLAIVKEIVDMHAGRIEVESKVGQGSTFTIFLPLDTRTALYI